MTTNTTQTGVEQAEPATFVDRIPTWATEVALEPDGSVLFTRIVRQGVEVT